MTASAPSANALRLLSHIGVLGLVRVPTARRWLANASCQPPEFELTDQSPHQLLVDISVIHQHDAGTGIQRVVRSVLGHLQITPLADRVVHPVAASAKRPYAYCHPRKCSGDACERVTARKGDVFLGLDLVAHLLPKHVSQLLEWKLSGARLYFVVYDILPLIHPSHFKPRRVQHFKRWVRLISILADGLLCISRTVQSDLQAWLARHFGLSPQHVPSHVIPLGGDFSKSINSAAPRIAAQAALSVLQDHRWALMVGTLEPRKCHAQVLDAFELLWQQGQAFCLVLIGRAGWHTQALQQRITQHPELNCRLYWFGDANDAELTLFYQQCTGVVAASVAEGYGLPLREAMAHSKPLLARDIPVFEEVAGNYAEYFADDSPSGLSTKLSHWLTASPQSAAQTPPLHLPTWAITTQRILVAIDVAPQVATTAFQCEPA